MEWFHNCIGVLPCMWNVEIANSVHITTLCVQWTSIYSMNWDALWYLVAMMSICSYTHKIGSWSNGQAFEYMIWPKAYNTFVRSSTFANCFYNIFYPCFVHMPQTSKKNFGPWLNTIAWEKSSIKISSCSSLIKCLWMWSKHEIEHAWMETNAL